MRWPGRHNVSPVENVPPEPQTITRAQLLSEVFKLPPERIADMIGDLEGSYVIVPREPELPNDAPVLVEVAPKPRRRPSLRELGLMAINTAIAAIRDERNEHGI